MKKINAYAREKRAEEARSVVEEWKAEKVYPYPNDPQIRMEEAERQVFEIVAVDVGRFLLDFEEAPKKSKAFHLRMLRQAIERSQERLQLILNEVLNLRLRKQNELAQYQEGQRCRL